MAEAEFAALLATLDSNGRRPGRQFEESSRSSLLNDPIYRAQLEEVCWSVVIGIGNPQAGREEG